ncbi:hypothetical protein SteCoe_34905 [Stentor coeruleus]|uniref:Fatty acyl-CoA reductase n=1 Tax=Stentor coeruleus TaxID=5963 RepID=A0A1R2ATM9_9CILI|nr:hypothetical protein SteCoe_34905 [Stentor coeruleus]
MVESFYGEKSILITGCTGFVGKVILEKILFSLPQVSRIYVFIRPREGSNIHERFQKEIINSPCFSRVKKMYSNFDSYIMPKLIPVSGDMMETDLGLSKEEYLMLKNNLNIIINSAASIKFNQRLDQILQMNTLGALKLVELAKQCHNFHAFIQISTAYVNSDKNGWIQEKVYAYIENPRKKLNELLSMPIELLEKQTPSIIGNHLNTYTYAKSLTEQILIDEGKGLPLCIVRPTFVGGSWEEPYPGWVDTVSAAAPLYLSAGLGEIRAVMGNNKFITDQIPVDYVANCVIVAAAYACKVGKLPIIHIGTSARNPVIWRKCMKIVWEYWNNYHTNKYDGHCKLTLVPDYTIYKILNYFTRYFPVLILTILTKVSKAPSLVESLQKMNKIIRKESIITKVISNFIMHEWIYESQQVIELLKVMSPKELQVFNFDVSKLDWKIYLTTCMQGLKKYILKEKVEKVDEIDLLSKFNYDSYFSDIKWAYKTGENHKTRNIKEMKSLILNAPRVKKAIEELKTQKKSLDADDQAQKIINMMIGDMRMPAIRMIAWGLRKFLRVIYGKLMVNHKQLNELAKIINNSKVPIVILPSHRSFIDYLVVPYLFFCFGIKMPYIAAVEDFLEISLTNKLFKYSGAFYIKHGKNSDSLYKAILTEYIQQLLKDQQVVEFFIEENRSRSGKISQSKVGLLSMCAETFYQGTVPDVKFLPITINYDRVLEGETFAFEPLGREKVRESLSRIINSVKILSKNFGKIHIVIGDLISLKDFSASLELNPVVNESHRVIVTKKLSQEVVLRLQENLAIITSTLVASILMMHRNGISEDNLVKKVEWLNDEIKFRGYAVAGLDEINV